MPTEIRSRDRARAPPRELVPRLHGYTDDEGDDDTRAACAEEREQSREKYLATLAPVTISRCPFTGADVRWASTSTASTGPSGIPRRRCALRCRAIRRRSSASWAQRSSRATPPTSPRSRSSRSPAPRCRSCSLPCSSARTSLPSPPRSSSARMRASRSRTSSSRARRARVSRPSRVGHRRGRRARRSYDDVARAILPAERGPHRPEWLPVRRSTRTARRHAHP